MFDIDYIKQIFYEHVQYFTLTIGKSLQGNGNFSLLRKIAA